MLGKNVCTKRQVNEVCFVACVFLPCFSPQFAFLFLIKFLDVVTLQAGAQKIFGKLKRVQTSIINKTIFLEI